MPGSSVNFQNQTLADMVNGFFESFLGGTPFAKPTPQQFARAIEHYAITDGAGQDGIDGVMAGELLKTLGLAEILAELTPLERSALAENASRASEISGFDTHTSTMFGNIAAEIAASNAAQGEWAELVASSEKLRQPPSPKQAR